MPQAIPAAIPKTGAREALCWLLRGRQRFVVRGRSMLPTLAEGATVLVEPGAVPAVGDVVVAWHPHVKDLVLIKRVDALDTGGRAVLHGDNPAESSHSFGALRPEAILGVVRSQLAP